MLVKQQKATALANFIIEPPRTEPPPYLRSTWGNKKIFGEEVMRPAITPRHVAAFLHMSGCTSRV